LLWPTQPLEQLPLTPVGRRGWLGDGAGWASLAGG